MEDFESKRPIDIIRDMNPGVSIPTGQELADFLRGGSNRKDEVDRCPRCGDPLFDGECIICD